jgi:hypothetical protein
MRILLTVLQMVVGQDPFLHSPMERAATCQGSSCLDLPEDRPAVPMVLVAQRLDSSRFFPETRRGLVRVLPPLPQDSSKLTLKGYKTLRTTVGSGGMLLQQEMEIDAKGEPSPGLEVRAHLVDHNAPVSQDGSTTTLRQTEEVWIEAKSRRFRSRLGDQSLAEPKELLGGVSRTARGLSLDVGDTTGHAGGAFGAMRSRWLQVELTAVEGQQEGYQLSLSGLSRAVVPGSEKVTLDGASLVRDQDYDIHNADGTIDFRPHKRILASSRIRVEYQALEQSYQRTVTQGLAAGQLGPLRLQAWAFKEADDPASPIAYTADSVSRRILYQAGTDTSRAHLPDGTSIALPTGLLRSGLSAQLNGPLQLRMDTRWTQLRPNLASPVTDPAGGAVAATGDWNAGTSLDKGGIGTLRLWGDAKAWQRNYQSLQSPQLDSLTGLGWTPPSNDQSPFEQEHLAARWVAMRDMGVSAKASHFRREDWADVSEGALRGGLERDSVHQAWLEGSYGQLDKGSLLERKIARTALAWDFVGWQPKLNANAGTRQDQPGSLPLESRWQEFTPGLGYVQPDWSVQSRFRTRFDQTQFGGASPTPADSARTLQATVEGKMETLPWSLSSTVDWLQSRERAAPQQAPLTREDWLAELDGRWSPHPTGLRTTGKYKLTTSSWRPLLAIYDTVPNGTGKYRYDSSRAQVVNDEFGNLLLAGTRLDTLHPAIQTGSTRFELGVNVIPHDLVPDLQGLLADIEIDAHLQLEQQDSARGTRFFPSWQDEELAASLSGTSDFGGELRWHHGKVRSTLSGSRSFSNARQNWSSENDQSNESNLKDYSIFAWNDWIRTSVEFETSSQDRKWSNKSSHEERSWMEPGQQLDWKTLTFQVTSKHLSGMSDGALERTVSLWSPALGITWQPRKEIHSNASLRYFSIQCPEGEPSSWMTDGYPVGDSWRAQMGLEWHMGEHFDATAEWVLRVTPNRPVEQRLTAEGKAIF